MSLTFKMNTNMFSRWQEWVNANAYTWFSMQLETLGESAPLIDLRFTSPVQYVYGQFDVIFVTVTAEQETLNL